jgi:S1-C subfamily serine protease
VAIRVRGPMGEGGGTGFFVDGLGTIATNHHVIAQATDVQVKLFDNTRIDDVELLADDEHADLALLRVNAVGHVRVAPLGDSDQIVVGERAISIGNPLGLEHTLTDGLVSSRRVWNGRPMVQMSVPVSPGNSGGPLFDLFGRVIGVTTAQVAGPFDRAQNLNLAIPVNVLKQMIRPDYPNRRRFGGGGSIPNTW